VHVGLTRQPALVLRLRGTPVVRNHVEELIRAIGA
jgi:hypothetical protein